MLVLVLLFGELRWAARFASLYPRPADNGAGFGDPQGAPDFGQNTLLDLPHFAAFEPEEDGGFGLGETTIVHGQMALRALNFEDLRTVLCQLFAGFKVRFIQARLCQEFGTARMVWPSHSMVGRGTS